MSHIIDSGADRRIILEGEVGVEWSGLRDERGSPVAVSTDLDLDGRVDVIVVEDRGTKGQKLHIYRNQIETGNHWIGVQLREEGNGLSPVGASVTVRTADRIHVGRVATGETLMGQHPTALHFGLAGSEQVESIEVQWVGGMKRIIENPIVDRYQLVLGRGQPIFVTPEGGVAYLAAYPKAALLDGPNRAIALASSTSNAYPRSRPIGANTRQLVQPINSETLRCDRAIACDRSNDSIERLEFRVNGEEYESLPKRGSGWGR